LGEKLAKDYLEKLGYSIIEKNYRCQSGEIDLIAKKDEYLVFIEVRSKRSLKYGTPEESVTQLKKARLIGAAEIYYQEHSDLPELYRIDFVAVEIGYDNLPRRFNLIENAISDY
jgi:putative endonuclease